MTKQFSGFTGEQMELIARKMGFQGPMDKFNEFLAASPDNAAKLSRYTQKAQSFLSAGAQPMAEGGEVKKPDDKGKKKPEPKPKPNMAETMTKKIVNNPMQVITKAKTEDIKSGPKQFIQDKGNVVGPAHVVSDPASVGKIDQAGKVKQDPTKTVATDLVAKDVNKALQGFQGAQGEVSAEAQAKAAKALPSANSTVQGQLEGLMAQFEGGETPPWAAGAMRKANAMMAARGMSSSSMAGAAITQAAMESALEIAIRDASTYSAFEMKNLDNRQQAALQNAQAFLAMDFENLDNEQEARMFKAQARVQSMFNDQAAENATRQFNATSKNQANQFFADLKQQVNMFNTNQKNSVKMFNTEQKNAIKTFNKQAQNQRDQFNATNRLIIDQSNAEWRRQISTINNEQQNENNRLNAQLATGLTTAAYNNLWQKERDVMAYVFTAAENAAERANQIILQKISAEAQGELADQQGKFEMWKAAGSVVGKILDIW